MNRVRKSYLAIIESIFVCCLIGFISARDLDSLVQHSLEFARQQLADTVSELKDTTQYPWATLDEGMWKTKKMRWIKGFFPGCLWYMYAWTSDEIWKDWAKSWTAGVEPEMYNIDTHDLGFIIFCSFGNGYRITSDQAYKEVILQGARSLATRYNSTVGCVRSWNNRTFPVIIDNMMNLEILFWASKNGGEPVWYEMALSHALKTMKNHVRKDGSTYQIVDYDPSSGRILNRTTYHGYADTSTWARGQAWGLYGFTMAFRETGDERFLRTAQRLADYFIDNLPEDQVPYWDFGAPNIPNEEKDASAAAIAASGLLELSTLAREVSNRKRYRKAACRILTSLCLPPYLAEGTNSSGILLHAVGIRPDNKDVDVSLIYADYYFIEALLRYRKIVNKL